MSQRHIVHYIPARKLPLITYTRDREDANRLRIGPEVYDQRKEQFVKSINSMLAYATTQNVCRSRHLLRYFGEIRSTDCGMCDVCLSRNADRTSNKALAPVRSSIMDILSDGGHHKLKELLSLSPNRDVVYNALENLINEEEISCNNDDVWKT